MNPRTSMLIARLLLVTPALACYPSAESPGPALPDVALACELGKLPIRSESQAICHIKHLIGVRPEVSDGMTRYSAERLGDVWRVSIVPPKEPYVGDGYIVEINAVSGDLMRPSQAP